MTGRTFRWLGFALLAIAAAALLGLTSMMRSAYAFGADIALIMGGTGPPPPFSYVIEANQVFISPGYTPEFLYTPENFAPFTGINSEPLSTSVAQGVADLDTAINTQVVQDNNDVVALGYSQSAVIVSLEEQQLAALPAAEQPSPDQLSFVLLGNPDNPDGGLFERLADAVIPALGYTTFFGPTPDDVYPTTIYTAEYDGFADFPQYPTNILADVNAFFGLLYEHTVYPFLTSAAGVVEPVSSAATDTTYILMPSGPLPLLDPLRGIVPAPLLDLIEPDLRAIIDLGYDRIAPQDVLTPAELFPTTFNPITVLSELIQGTVQGIDNALADEGLPALPNVPFLSDLLNLLNSLAATTTFTLPEVTFAVPAQISDVIDSPLNELDALLNTGIDDQLDPAIQSTISTVGDALTTVATSLGAPALLTNAILVGEELAPLDVEAPGVLLTTDAQGLVNAVEDLAAGNLSDFGQELQSIGAQDIIMAEFFGVFNVLALVDIFTGMPPDTVPTL